VPITSEEVEVTKRPHIEEVVVKKEPVTETKTVTDSVRSERVDKDARDTTTTPSKGTQMAEDNARAIKEGAVDVVDKARSAFDNAKENAKNVLK
jgi:hypothetical protein